MGEFLSSCEIAELRASTRFKVLVADDNATNRRLLEVLFEVFECAVTVAEDGLEALDLALGHRFDIVCLDRFMPGLTGDQVAQRLRAGCGLGPSPYLVLCTSDPRPGDGRAPFDAAMPKPIGVQDVAEVLAQARDALRRSGGSQPQAAGTFAARA